jgi:hypothetical protein
MWFVEKLGPLPGSPQAKNAPKGGAKPAPAAKSAAPPQPQRTQQQPAPAAEAPKKKKGWF